MALSKMGAHIGRVIRFDQNTEEALRGRFARVCVELNLTKALMSRIKVGRHLQNVEYEGINLIYFQCVKVGHKKDGCPYIIPVPSQSAQLKSMPDLQTASPVHEVVQEKKKSFGP
ncbi:hypothetical protein REPUB_Repub14bG0066100 [Reevesia pubescens]